MCDCSCKHVVAMFCGSCVVGGCSVTWGDSSSRGDWTMEMERMCYTELSFMRCVCVCVCVCVCTCVCVCVCVCVCACVHVCVVCVCVCVHVCVCV